PNNRIFINQYYTAERNKRQTYDLVFPKKASGNLGLVLCIHGGAWNTGSKDSYTKNIMRVSEEKGVAAACINYRYLSDEINFNDILDDITSALTAIKAKGAEYGVNFDKMLLTGGSAGGHLSLLYAYSRKDEAPIKPACVVETCGPTNFEEMLKRSATNRMGQEYTLMLISQGIGCKADMNNIDEIRDALKAVSPITYVDENTVPTIFGHGDIDDVVPYQNSLELKEKLDKFGVENTFISFPNTNHECDNKESMSKVMQLFFESIDKYL
ncbi:MAG: alpha/beta hydrolase, partial [Ruminococcus sp.]|nr:alpha/beta hydrolase [Candidatus Copronaster equi]